jgi:hypothetical protein
MTYSAPEDDARLCHVHSLALCTEIGERLRTSLARPSVALPPSLRTLMMRMRDAPPVLET